MLYLSSFDFPDREAETGFFLGEKRTCYDSYYPFGVLSKRRVARLTFAPVTVLYGGNGCGKTTALCVIAEKLRLPREAAYNRTEFMQDYVDMCDAEQPLSQPGDSRMIASDDVFDYMLNIRNINDGIDAKRRELFEDYLDDKYAEFKLSSIEDYDKLKRVNAARKKSQSRYVRGRLMDNVREMSNGESAFFYFTQRIRDNGLYLLDEPENSLSPAKQMELARFIEDGARFFGDQFVIATHSPFLLSMRGARIYDLDQTPAAVRKWTELENVREYYDFFKAHEGEFM